MTTTSRRSFLKLGLAATAGGVGLAQAKPVFEPASFDKETDVVIIGTGAAGSSAAARCSQLGLKVIVLEKMPVGGGSSVLCNGGFAVCCTDVQERKRIKDSPELFEKELLTMGKVNDPELVHTFVTASLPTYKWMRGLGVEVNDVTTGAGMSVPRQHMTRPPQMLGIFREITEKAGGQYLFKTAEAPHRQRGRARHGRRGRVPWQEALHSRPQRRGDRGGRMGAQRRPTSPLLARG